MTTKAKPTDSRYPAPGAALLSYLVPGLGQIVQGRTAKGVLFLVALYGLFFYGMYLGKWQNVYIFTRPPAEAAQTNFFTNITDRARFIGQAWIGVVAWPAVIQYLDRRPVAQRWLGSFMLYDEDVQERLLQESDKRFDIGWVLTVIAGVLNILVIYDAYAGPVCVPEPKQQDGDGDTPPS